MVPLASRKEKAGRTGGKGEYGQVAAQAIRNGSKRFKTVQNGRERSKTVTSGHGRSKADPAAPPSARLDASGCRSGESRHWKD
jgi:hypothetical protein